MNFIWNHKSKRQHRRVLQAGNAIIMLFAAIGMAGVVTYGLNNVMRGPAVATAEISRRTIAENNLVASTRLAVAAATRTQTNNGDCDGDGMVEPVPFRTPGTALHPAGGGLLPLNMGGSLSDPWGNQYGYCVWDSGTVSVSANVAACGGSAANRLEGAPREDQPVIAIISAGRDGAFQTSCNPYVDTTPADGIPDTVLINKPAGSDDIVLSHTYAEANGIGGGEWKLKAGDSTTAEIAKDLEVTGGAQFSGGLNLTTKGLVLPGDPGTNMVTGICDASKDQQLRRRTDSSPPKLQICDFANSGDWVDVSGSVAPPANLTGFKPDEGNCAMSAGGPLALIDSVAPAGGSLGIWGDGQYIYATNGANGLFAYRFNGTSFSPAGSFDTAGTSYHAWGNGTHVFVSDEGPGVHAYTYNGSTFTPAGTYNSSGIAYDVAGDGSYIYVADGASGVHALTYNGTSFSLQSTYNTPGSAVDLYIKNGYIYVADASSGIAVLTFNGTSFTQVASFDTPGTASRVWADERYVYVADGSGGLRVYAFNGSSLTFVTSAAVSSNDAEGIWGDGVYIYATNGADGIVVLTFNGTNFTQMDSIDTTDALDIWGDGTYIYLADNTGGVRAFSGYECFAAKAMASSDPVQAPLPDPLDQNMIAHWKFDEGTGTTAYDSVGTNHATFMNTPIWRRDGVDGSSALHFNMNDRDALQVTGLLGSPTTGTISLWANIESADTSLAGTLISLGNMINIEVREHRGFSLTYYKGSSQWNFIENSREHAIGTGWRHVVGTFDDPNNTFRLYVDGVLKAELITADAITTTSYSNTIFARHGCNCLDTYDVTGAMDDVRVYNRALSPSEVERLYKRSKAGASVGSSPAIAPILRDETSRIGAGYAHTCGLRYDGSAWCWGNNDYGQVGDGRIGTGTVRAARVENAYPFTSIASGYYFNCGITNPGRLWCWGRNNSGQIAASGGINAGVPVEVPSGGVNWTSVTAGETHACGIKQDGSSWCWGSDTNGELGNGATAGIQYTPTEVTGSYKWKMLSANQTHTCGIQTDGTAWCWGSDSNGKLGNGGSSTGNQPNPSQVDDPGPWAWISAGQNHTCGVKVDGSGWCWGIDTNGRLGNGPALTVMQDSPSLVFSESNWVSISAGIDMTCGIKTNGSSWCWGLDTNGMLGNGSTLTADQSTPSLISVSHGWTGITLGYRHACGVQRDGVMWCWGSDADGQLGNRVSVTADQHSPYPIPNSGEIWTWQWSNEAQNLLLNPGYNAAIGNALFQPASGSTQTFGFTNAGYARYRTATNSQVQISANAATRSSQVSFKTSPTSGATDITANRVGYWTMDDAPGSTTITATNGSNGTLYNGATTTGTFGKMAGSLSMISISAQHGRIANAAYLRPASITIAFWVKLYGPQSNDATIFNKAHTNRTGAILQSYGAYFANGHPNKFSFSTGGGGTHSELLSQTPLNYNEWNYVTLVMDPGGSAPQKRIYINGMRDHNVNTTTAIAYDAGASGDLFIGQGGCASPCLPFNGEIDDFRIYNGAASDAQVAQLYGFVTTAQQVPRSMGVSHVSGNIQLGRNNAGVTNMIDAIAPDMTITPAGRVGIGTATPQAAMDVIGGVRFGADYICNAASAGKVRYVSTAAVPWQYCNGTAWTNFSNVIKPIWQMGDGNIAVGGTKTCSRRIDGTVWCWGRQSYGQLGNGVTNNSAQTTPVQVRDSAGTGYWNDWVYLNGEWRQICGIRSNGTAWCWGNGLDGIIGNGNTTDRNLPTQVRDSAGTGYWNDWLSVDGDGGTTCGVRSNGTAWCWGQQASGALGNGQTATAAISTPVQVQTSSGPGGWSDWKMIAVDGNPNVCGLRSNGTLWCWGSDAFGKLGDNGATVGNASRPVQVRDSAGTGHWNDWVFVSAGPSTNCGIRSNGTLWCWGRNQHGQIGNGGTSNTNRPSQVRDSAGTGYWNDWVTMTQDSGMSCGVRRDGSGWCWGTGELGDGVFASNSPLPKRVMNEDGSGHWNDWLSMFSSYDYTCGNRANGSMWCWGGTNTYGTYGNGTTTPSAYPVQVNTP